MTADIYHKLGGFILTMKRQAMIVTINQLDRLIQELYDEFDDGSSSWASDDNRKFQINIINKTPKCSDTWELENHSQESPSVEKLDEMPDYETTNGVVARDTRIPSNDKNVLIHPDSLIKTKLNDEFSWRQVVMVEKSPCSGCERRMTESIRKGRCSYFCKECGYDKSLSDIYWAEATCNTGEKNNGL